MNLLNWIAAFSILIAGAVLSVWTDLLARSKNYRVAIGGNLLKAIFVLVLVTGVYFSDLLRKGRWSGNPVLDMLIVMVVLLAALFLVMYFCSKLERCRIILDTRNCSVKEKRLYLYRRLQEMNAGFRVVYVVGKNILLWLLYVTLIAGLLAHAVVSDDASIIQTGLYFLLFTGQALQKFDDVKRKRKLLRRFENGL